MTSLIANTGANTTSTLLVGKTHVLANHDVGMDGDFTGQTLLDFGRQAGEVNSQAG